MLFVEISQIIGVMLVPPLYIYQKQKYFSAVIFDSNQGARFMTCNLKDHYLASPMDKPHYIKIKWEHIPDDIRFWIILPPSFIVVIYMLRSIKEYMS